ncbi:MAG: mandelate racemase [Actinomycetota bacterium]|nr:mandelate racemase [Actinomycetota bacterium]
MALARESHVEELHVEVFDIPTDQPEADGTLSWDATTLVLVRARGGGCEGLGWTYDTSACKAVIDDQLASVVCGHSIFDVPAANEAMRRACRNLGGPGVAACAISAVDIALWDLKARVLELPLADLLGRAVKRVPIYGSGGFTSYDDQTTRAQLERFCHKWSIPRVKIKVGESRGQAERRDLERVALARKTIGPDVELFVDANGAYTRKQAIRLGAVMAAEHGVSWFEEPVSSDDLAGLREVRDQCQLDVAAGEYGYAPWYFAPMIAAEAVDCIQADVTRCGGITAWRDVAGLAAAHQLQISGHCAPNLHVHVAISAANLRHLEYFHDHVQIEEMLFDGTLPPTGGALVPERQAPGHGMTLRENEAARYRVA